MMSHDDADAAASLGLNPHLTVGQVSEEELVAAFAPSLPDSPVTVVGNGDDCAVLAAPDGRYVVSTDVLVEGHHFRRDWSSPQDIGARAAAQNLADAAAMGARPVAMVVGLVVPVSTPLEWVRALSTGMGRACAQAGAGVVGGDLSAGEQVMISVTVHGDLEGRDPVLRSGARPGDTVVLAGGAGMSAAGYALAQAGYTGEEGRERLRHVEADLAERVEECLAVFRCPRPPLEQAVALARIGASAMMDVSDSLVRDSGRIGRASGVVIDLDDPADGGGLAHDQRYLEPVARLLLGEDASSAQVAARARTWVLTGGEDHGILATLPALADISGIASARRIGRVCSLREVSNRADTGHCVDMDGGCVRVGGVPWGGSLGWDHFGQ